MIKGKMTHSDKKISAQILQREYACCDDFVLRPIWPGHKSFGSMSVCWLDGVVSAIAVAEDVLRPLTEAERLGDIRSIPECMDWLMHGGVYASVAKERRELADVLGDLNQGFCAVVFDSAAAAITFEVRSTATRAITEPTVEKTVKGSKDSFVETVRVNTSLVRRKLRTPGLKCEMLTVGKRSSTPVALMYLDGIIDPALPQEMKRRLNALDIDGLISAGNLEQYIVDHPRSPFPQLLHTERPDKFAEELLQGRVGIIADGLPLGFLAPAALARFLRVSDDRAQHYLVTSVLTLLRWFSLVLTILLPAAFVAVAMYHQEMLPFKLMTSMIDAKQQVPFSVAIEVLAMLLAFELLQEAGLRLPTPIGDTVSIIGALIVGQSAVEARVVSPVAVIVVATAGICGFTQPSRDMGAALRLVRFFMVLMAIFLGMYGLMLGLALFVWHLCTLESFGISYTAPMSEGGFLATLYAFIQAPLWRDKYRPAALRPQDRRNQK